MEKLESSQATIERKIGYPIVLLRLAFKYVSLSGAIRIGASVKRPTMPNEIIDKTR